MAAWRKWLEGYAEPLGERGVALARALARVRTEKGVDFTRARARAGFGRGHLLDVALHLPGGSGSERERVAADELLSQLLGPLPYERWIGALSVLPAARGGPLVVVKDRANEQPLLELSELVPALRAAQRGLYDGLPAKPHAQVEDAADWLMFELTPEPAHDYAAQDDLAIATTSVPELKKCFLRGEPFFSGRFSKHGELFVYLKYEGEAEDSEARLAERGKLEAALDAALRPELGALVGAGFGLRYGYLDLALRDASRALDALPKLLRDAGAPERSWLLFCDSELEREQVAIWPRAPKPFLG